MKKRSMLPNLHTDKSSKLGSSSTTRKLTHTSSWSSRSRRFFTMRLRAVWMNARVSWQWQSLTRCRRLNSDAFSAWTTSGRTWSRSAVRWADMERSLSKRARHWQLAPTVFSIHQLTKRVEWSVKRRNRSQSRSITSYWTTRRLWHG